MPWYKHHDGLEMVEVSSPPDTTFVMIAAIVLYRSYERSLANP